MRDSNIPVIGWESFPKLYFSQQTLGRAISCAREDLRLELLNSATSIYNNLPRKLERDAITSIDFNDNDGDTFVDEFLDKANGKSVRTSETYTEYSPQVNFKSPGDARIVQRLSAAAFFETDLNKAEKYREVARRILLHWAKHTFTDRTVEQDKMKAQSDGNFGLSIGSSMTAFAFGYDLLASGQGITNIQDRKIVENWFRKAADYIVISNNAWMQSCVDGSPFYYDGKSCSRAMGDNHVTVATTAIYALSIMSGNTSLAESALVSPTSYKWGYKDRLGSIIYNINDKVAPQDRFPFVHTGEIYDRWRGHYVERSRQLQLHRSMAYPYLSLSFLTAQALIAKRQGVNLLEPVQKSNGKSISLTKSFLFYGMFLNAYDPGEIIDPLTPKVGFGSNYFPGIRSVANYTSLDQTYCVNGFNPLITDNNCQDATSKGFVIDRTSRAYTQGYYHLIFSAASYLLKHQDSGASASIAGTITIEKMRKAENAYSSHIMPFEPAFFIEK